VDLPALVFEVRQVLQALAAAMEPSVPEDLPA
jgi:hypothetical protein